jgi:hypothetical protein
VEGILRVIRLSPVSSNRFSACSVTFHAIASRDSDIFSSSCYRSIDTHDKGRYHAYRARSSDPEKQWYEIVKYDHKAGKEIEVVTVRGISLANQQVEARSNRRTPEEKDAGIDYHYREGEKPADYKRAKSHGSRPNPRR